ncbi:MAG: DNA-directed RNA polymerase subunit beta [Candidatus Vogelbacteria bacterium CG10_big_fil_rev_8_21_14_0_10_45_14]|uniref:DNA-directed RNA polymerase subunit beta n=1 Tax=Candidatus Vogelbacteria bacterium CG10_big_fil_rev_8_21_14_0_10_45_14 TaxID=1975042 RepID=A0A2H0RJZ3_9BACT|nr:MAG: DNA-directed RNA polymerase subunit beta [Candidatus Vogelbacteria bacterium CG10_big_fil_rev_8_21_14_0_10_45_14]
MQNASESRGKEKTVRVLPQKRFSRYKEPLAPYPSLAEIQTSSYDWLVKEGVGELLKEFSPISDYTGKKFDLFFESFEFDSPKFNEHHAKENKMNYEAPLRVRVRLVNKMLGSDKEQEVFLADFPVMTDHGTFVVNGVERVVVSQLVRSYGAFFTAGESRGERYFGAKIIPARGVWIEIETDSDGAIYVRIDKKRKFPISSLLRVFTEESDEDIMKRFEKITSSVHYIANSFAKDPAKTREDSYVEMYRRLRDSDLASPQAAKDFINNLFTLERYDLSPVGRFRLNERFGITQTKNDGIDRTLRYDDLVRVLSHVILLNEDPLSMPDDIDHLGFRRVRSVGEMLQQKMRVGFQQMKRYIQDRMSTIDVDTTLPTQLVSPRPFQARVKEFFTTNQLSQLMQQENVLAELEHLRKLSALGPGGLSRERAGFEVRDVHPSHYGRLCPIQTPEGPNIGLILTLASHARINSLGIIETPYAKVNGGKLTGEVVFMNALEEEDFTIAHGATATDESGKITDELVEVRKKGKPMVIARDAVMLMEVVANQPFSIATAMVPFIEHDAAERAAMGSNMQRQATPCVVPEAPVVATGIETIAARHAGRSIYAKDDGTIMKADAKSITIKYKEGKSEEINLINFTRSNNFTILHQRPTVSPGASVKKGDLLADASTTEGGQMALGQNVVCAFMSWQGANYEDAIIISERLVKRSKFTSIHVEEFSSNVRDTKLGPEITTHDIPNVGEAKLKNLDEDGIIQIGAEVGPNDILVGKITPKGETELTPEERLLRSIFGEKSRDVKDSSLRMPYGKRGRVVGVKVFSRDRGDKLESGIIKRVHIEVAQLRNISVGDKLAGRHGNKGIISRILPEEDMPYMKDGTPVDIILTPLGVVSRMNLGQILEMHLGLAADALGYQAITPTFLSVTEEEIRGELKKAGKSEDGKMILHDGRTGEEFNQPIAVGVMYVLKLHHMVEDKIHMRSIGPYSLITQQPLGGKAQGGGQRFGEMEVWALEGYGAAHMLREMLTIKSDDILGRSATFDSIVKGETVRDPNLPASFNVLLNELRGLALDVDLVHKNKKLVKADYSGKGRE